MSPSTETSGKPEDIPQDVLVTARKAVMAEVSPDVRWQYASGRNDHFAVVKAVARAILAERERCAQLADDHAGPFASGSIFGAGATFAAKNIAAAIRQLGDVSGAHNKISGEE